MVLKYTNYDNLNFKDEKMKIENATSAEINLQPKNKGCLFILGMLFVKGVPIKITNENELDLTTTKKSFSVMPYVWSKMGDPTFPKEDGSDIQFEIDRRVAEAKRRGERLEETKNNPTPKKIFLICPVRDANPEQKKWIEDFVAEQAEKGYRVHAPHMHTKQEDELLGYHICRDNEQAAASAEEIDVYYDQTSTGSVFDLGAAYILEKPLKVLNKEEVVWNSLDPIDELVSSWPFQLENIEYVKN